MYHSTWIQRRHNFEIKYYIHHDKKLVAYFAQKVVTNLWIQTFAKLGLAKKNLGLPKVKIPRFWIPRFENRTPHISVSFVLLCFGSNFNNGIFAPARYKNRYLHQSQIIYEFFDDSSISFFYPNKVWPLKIVPCSSTWSFFYECFKKILKFSQLIYMRCIVHLATKNQQGIEFEINLWVAKIFVLFCKF